MKVKVKASPNPFNAELSITMLSQLTVNLVVRLMNSNGTVIRVKACPLITGENNVQLKNLNRYASGDYILEVKLLNGDLLDTISLVKA